jgi:hypothetical protein
LFLTLQRYGEKTALQQKEVENRISTTERSFPALHPQIFHLLSIMPDGKTPPPHAPFALSTLIFLQ